MISTEDKLAIELKYSISRMWESPLQFRAGLPKHVYEELKEQAFRMSLGNDKNRKATFVEYVYERINEYDKHGR